MTDRSPLEADLRDALGALRAGEPARPDDQLWEAIASRGKDLTVQNPQRRALGLAAAAVLAVVMLGAGIAIGGRDGAPAAPGQPAADVQVGGTPPGTDQAPGGPIRFASEYKAAIDLAHQSEREGLLSAAHMTDPALVSDGALAEQRAATDEAIERWRAIPADPAAGVEATDTALRIENRLTSLPVLRRSVDDLQTHPSEAALQFDSFAIDAMRIVPILGGQEASSAVGYGVLGLHGLARSTGTRVSAAERLITMSTGADTSLPARLAPDEVGAAVGDLLVEADIYLELALELWSVPAKQAHRDAFADDRLDALIRGTMESFASGAVPAIDRAAMLDGGLRLADASAAAGTAILDGL